MTDFLMDLGFKILLVVFRPKDLNLCTNALTFFLIQLGRITSNGDQTAGVGIGME